MFIFYHIFALQNVLSDHPGAAKRKRMHIRDSKKLGCTAELTIRKIVYYPQYNVENDLNGASGYMVIAKSISFS